MKLFKINMDLIYILDPNNIFCYKILENINFVCFFNLLEANSKINTNLKDNNKFWYNCCMKYKNNFFWEFAMMRSENNNWLCNIEKTFKQELRNLYFYDNLLKKSNKSQNDITYFYQWIMIEYYNDKFVIAFNMLDCLYNNYFNPKILNLQIPTLIPGRKTLSLKYKDFKSQNNLNLKKKNFEQIMGFLSNLFCNNKSINP